MSKDRCWHRVWLGAGLVVLAFALFAILTYLLFGPLSGVALGLERVSAFIAIVDDTFVRIVSTVVLVMSGAGLVWAGYRDLWCRKKPGGRAAIELALGDAQGAFDHIKALTPSSPRSEIEAAILQAALYLERSTETLSRQNGVAGVLRQAMEAQGHLRFVMRGELPEDQEGLQRAVEEAQNKLDKHIARLVELRDASDDGEEHGKWAVANKYFVFAAGAALSGLGYVAADKLDGNDNTAKATYPSQAYTFLQETDPQGNSPKARDVTVLARWVQVAPAGDACVLKAGQVANGAYEDCDFEFLVRAVVPASQDACPTARVSYASGESNRTLLPRPHSKPYAWGFGDILVCEARLPARGGAQPLRVAVGNTPSVPLAEAWDATAGPNTIAIVGDTGCRGNKDQICNAEKWKFANVAKRMAADAPDLLMHVGDFMYVKIDTWDAWKMQFFDPAKAALDAGPWVMIRGNHERCGKFGDAPLGYYLFFDIGNPNDYDCKNEGELTSTYAVDIGADRRIVVSDSSTAYANPREDADENVIFDQNGRVEYLPMSGQPAYDLMTSMMKQVKALSTADREKTLWFATHIPIYSAGECSDQTGDLVCNGNEGTALMRATWFKQSMPGAGIDAVVAGHHHMIQFGQASGLDTTVQIVSGAGGVNLDKVPWKANTNQACNGPDSLTSPLGLTTKLRTIFDGTDADPMVDLTFCSNPQEGYVSAVGNRFTFVPVK